LNRSYRVKERIKSVVLDLVAKRDHVSFAEFDRFLIEAGIAPKGDLELTYDDGNLVLWQRMSQDYVDAIGELIAEKALYVHPATFWTYLADGTLPGLPIAKRIPRGGYKNPHWLPVCFRLVPC
jgi:hypothetical protein